MKQILECISFFETALSSKKFSIAAGKYHSLYEPIDYILALDAKRIRPALVLATAGYFGVNRQEALDAAMAVELFHNFSLMHDDIMDGASSRRSQDTVHIKFDQNAAILSGDAMIIMAYEHICRYEDSIAIQLIKVFNKMGIELCEGQRSDMDFEKRLDVGIDEYIQMIGFKTSVLLGACMQFGAIIGKADITEQFHLYEFGKNIGIAFQIQDDILDTFGDENMTGKRKGGDILNNKKTYLYLKSLELSDPKLKSELLEWTHFTPHDQESEELKISAVKRIFDTLVVEEYANQLKEAYRDLAISHLKQIQGLSESSIMELSAFADFLVKREK